MSEWVSEWLKDKQVNRGAVLFCNPGGLFSVLSNNLPADSLHSGFLHSHLHCLGQYRKNLCRTNLCTIEYKCVQNLPSLVSPLFVDFQRNRARYEKRLDINNKRLELAKAYKEEEANNYFRSIAPLTKLFVTN